MLGTMFHLVQSSNWRTPHPCLLWLSVSLADTVRALCLLVSLLSQSGTTTWLDILTTATSYSSIISVSSLSMDKMFSIAKPFNYTLYRQVIMILDLGAKFMLELGICSKYMYESQHCQLLDNNL